MRELDSRTEGKQAVETSPNINVTFWAAVIPTQGPINAQAILGYSLGPLQTSGPLASGKMKRLLQLAAPECTCSVSLGPQINCLPCAAEKKNEIDKLAAEYIANVRKLASEQRVEHLQKIETAYRKCKEYSDDKVQLAMQTYEMVSAVCLREGGRGGAHWAG